MQKHLKQKALSYGVPLDLRFCWDLHILTIQRRKALLSVNCNSRYAVLLYGLKGGEWKRLPELVQEEVKAAFLREGISEFEIARYFSLSGPAEITRTHGRKPVAGLNRAVDALYAVSPPLDESSLSQPLANLVMNDDICHAAGYTEYGTPREFLLADFKNL